MRKLSQLLVCSFLAARAWGDSRTQMQQALGISPAVGTVVDAMTTGTGDLPDFILIQDVHRHPEAQEHIAALIEHAHTAWGLHQVFVEGAVGPVDLTPYRALMDPEILLHAEVVEGTLSGAKLGALLIREGGDSAFQLTGIETPGLYEADLRAFQEVQNARQAALTELDGLLRLNPLPGFPDNLYGRLERLIRLKLTAAEFVDAQNEDLKPIGSPNIARAAQMAELFYQIADLRTEGFLKRLAGDRTASCHVAVMGAFHAACIAKVLRQAHRSFAMIAPVISQPRFDDLYEEQLAETVVARNIH